MNGDGAGAGAGVDSGASGVFTAGVGPEAGCGATVPGGRNGVIAGTSRPPARVASSDWAAICRSGASIDAEGGADSHPGRADVRAQVALRRRTADRGGGVTREPDVSIRRDPHGRGAEATHGDAGLVKGGDSGKYGGPEGGRGWRRQRSSRQDRAERRALVGFDRDPEPVVVDTPAEDGGEGRMAMLKQALQSRYGRSRFGRWHRNLVDHGRLAALENSLPTLARARRHKFDQPGFRL